MLTTTNIWTERHVCWRLRHFRLRFKHKGAHDSMPIYIIITPESPRFSHSSKPVQERNITGPVAHCPAIKYISVNWLSSSKPGESGDMQVQSACTAQHAGVRYCSSYVSTVSEWQVRIFRHNFMRGGGGQFATTAAPPPTATNYATEYN